MMNNPGPSSAAKKSFFKGPRKGLYARRAPHRRKKNIHPSQKDITIDIRRTVTSFRRQERVAWITPKPGPEHLALPRLGTRKRKILEPGTVDETLVNQ